MELPLLPRPRPRLHRYSRMACIPCMCVNRRLPTRRRRSLGDEHQRCKRANCPLARSTPSRSSRRLNPSLRLDLCPPGRLHTRTAPPARSATRVGVGCCRLRRRRAARQAAARSVGVEIRSTGLQKNEGSAECRLLSPSRGTRLKRRLRGCTAVRGVRPMLRI